MKVIFSFMIAIMFCVAHFWFLCNFSYALSINMNIFSLHFPLGQHFAKSLIIIGGLYFIYFSNTFWGTHMKIYFTEPGLFCFNNSSYGITLSFSTLEWKWITLALPPLISSTEVCTDPMHIKVLHEQSLERAFIPTHSDHFLNNCIAALPHLS